MSTSSRLTTSSKSRRCNNGAQHPRLDLSATSDGGTTDATACWVRLVRQWLLPSHPLDSIELTVEDLSLAFREIFSAGGVHHASVCRGLVDKLGGAPDEAWLGPISRGGNDAARSGASKLAEELPDTVLDESAADCSGMT